jgi:hypothetical protein
MLRITSSAARTSREPDHNVVGDQSAAIQAVPDAASEFGPPPDVLA